MNTATLFGLLSAFTLATLARAGVDDLRLASDPVDMGVLISDTKVTGMVLVSNAGTVPTTLDAKIRTDCGCTNARLSTTVVPPGESALVSFTLNTKGMDGSFRKSIFLREASTGEELEATLVGRVVPPLTQSGPLLLQADTLEPTTSTASCRVVVRRREATIGPTSVVRSMTPAHPAVSVVWSPVGEDEWTTTYEVHAMLDTAKLTGTSSTMRTVPINIAFEDVSKPELTLLALLDLTAGIRPVPDGARFSTQEIRTTTQRRTIQLQPIAGREVAIRAVRAVRGDKISIDLRQEPPGASLVVTLPRDETAASSDHVVDYIEVAFDYAGTERTLRIPVASY